jgi:hypothetical protein
MRMTMKSSKREKTMNATNRSIGRIGLVFCSALALGLVGCRTVVHERTNTVYVPEPAPEPPPVIVAPPPVVVQQSPPVVVIQSENDFYEPLTPHGRWVVVGSYGRCWVPARVEADWRPYSNGYWQRTDAGWYWESDEPWGWATYHYGRWDWDVHFGWFWVPRTQWAPAWVVWREGGGYVGWAPLRPSVNISINVGRVDYEPAFSHRAFVFVEHRRMLEPVRPKTVVVNNTTIINKTVNITNVKVVNKTVINEGPRPEVIERESGRKVRPVPVQEVRRKEETTVVARERNVPTAERRALSPKRTEPQPATKQTSPSRNDRVVVRPVDPVPQPAVQPVSLPTREVRKAESPPTHKEQPSTRVVENKTKPEQPARHGREVWPDGRPTVAAKPKPVTPLPAARETLEPVKQSAQTSPARQLPPARTAREERGHEVNEARKEKSTPPGLERKAANEAKPEPAAVHDAVKQSPVHPSQPSQPANANPQVAPQKKAPTALEKSRRPEQAQDNKEKGKGKGKKKDQETP